MGTDIRLFGADYSVYVRIARLALEEKGVDYELVPVDIFAEGGPSADYLARHPFARIPAFDHGGFQLYETGAITRYIDEAFEGQALQPKDAETRARCNQIISIADNYAYMHMVWGVFVEQVEKPTNGQPMDEARFAASLEISRQVLSALSGFKQNGPWLLGDTLSLGDLYCAPIFDYFLMAEDGKKLFSDYPALQDWWTEMSARPSMLRTAPTV